MDESSDDDIEIIATKEVKNKILEVHRYEETKRDLEEIEQKCFAEKSQQTLPVGKKKEKEDINISIRKSAMNITISMASGSGTNKRKKDTDIICIDSDDGGEGEPDDDGDVQVKVIVSGGGQNKRLKTSDSREKSAENFPSSSKLSTSEMFLNKQHSEDSSEENAEEDEDVLVEESGTSLGSPGPVLESIGVSHCLDSFLSSCRRILPLAEFQSVEKKLMKNLNRLDPKHLYNCSLKNFIDQKWSLVNSDQDSLYVHIKEMLEELKKFRSESFVSSGDTSEMSDQELIKTQTKKRIPLTTLSSVVKKPEARRDEEDEPSLAADFEPETESSKEKTVSSKHIRKLEAALAACGRQIKKCEEAEIDWEKDDDSNFLMADRWKKKYMSIYFKLAEYNGISKSLERSSDKKFSFNESKFPAINRKIEKFVNRTKSFPDFWDVKKQIENINTEDSLHLTEMQIHNEAEKIFISVGRRLKKRRNNDDGSVMFSYLNPAESDPALNDAELDSKLALLGKEAKERIEKVFEEYTEKQAAGVRSNDEESETEEEEEEEEENDEDVDVESFVTDESALEVQEPQPVIEGGESDGGFVESPPRPLSDCSVKSSGSIKDLLEDSD